MSLRRTARPRGQGVHDEPAYLLHRYEWSETSLILELFTRNHGRVAVAAKGVRRPASSFRSVLLAFQPLLVSLGPEAEIRQLRGVEWAGGYTMPTGEPLLVGYYLNELLMRFLHRDDAQPLLFDTYAQTLAIIAQQKEEQLTPPLLRAFELMLLRTLGVLPALNHEGITLDALLPNALYTLNPESGLLPYKESWLPHLTTRAQAQPLAGNIWQQIHEALDSDQVLTILASTIAPVENELKYLLRPFLHLYAGTDQLYTRQLMQELQRSRTLKDV